MKVFMVGWEFPPFISGGLGTACHGLARAMDQLGVGVLFVLPKSASSGCGADVMVLGSSGCPGECFGGLGCGEFKNVSFRTVASPLQAYSTASSYKQHRSGLAGRGRCESGQGCTEFELADAAAHYGASIYEEVHRYADAVGRLAGGEDFDVIHVHDWMTYPAGMSAAAVSGKPLVVQVHSTEFDRSGEHVNQMIYDIERRGMQAAQKVVAVSNFTRNVIISRYGVPPEKVEVVYNGVEHKSNGDLMSADRDESKRERIVLFLGRMTMQKGPDYFVAAAKKVLGVMDNVKFVMAGAGDMLHRIIELAAWYGIGQKVTFTGFLQGSDVDRIYEMAELYVMPSVSEPFGIAPLEALNHDVPVLISKQSGVSEVLHHALKVDFWDVNEIANKIVAVLRYPALKRTLGEQGSFEAGKLRWQDAAEQCLKIYNGLVAVT